MLTKSKKRTFIVEIERTQIVRRTSESHFLDCADCQAKADFISLKQGECLFSTDSAKLFEFIKTNSGHYKTNRRGEVFICLTSLAAIINGRTKKPTIKLLGD